MSEESQSIFQIPIIIWIFHIFPKLNQKEFESLLIIFNARKSEKWRSNPSWKNYLVMSGFIDPELDVVRKTGRNYMEIAIGYMISRKTGNHLAYSDPFAVDPHLTRLFPDTKKFRETNIPNMWYGPPPVCRHILSNYPDAYHQFPANKETYYTSVLNEKTSDFLKVMPEYFVASRFNLNYLINCDKKEYFGISWCYYQDDQTIDYDPFSIYLNRNVRSDNAFEPVDEYFYYSYENDQQKDTLYNCNADFSISCPNNPIEPDSSRPRPGTCIWSFVSSYGYSGGKIDETTRMDNSAEESEKNKIIYQYYRPEERKFDSYYVESHRNSILLGDFPEDM